MCLGSLNVFQNTVTGLHKATCVQTAVLINGLSTAKKLWVMKIMVPGLAPYPGMYAGSQGVQ